MPLAHILSYLGPDETKVPRQRLSRNSVRSQDSGLTVLNSPHALVPAATKATFNANGNHHTAASCVATADQQHGNAFVAGNDYPSLTAPLSRLGLGGVSEACRLGPHQGPFRHTIALL